MEYGRIHKNFRITFSKREYDILIDVAHAYAKCLRLDIEELQKIVDKDDATLLILQRLQQRRELMLEICAARPYFKRPVKPKERRFVHHGARQENNRRQDKADDENLS